MLLRKRRLLVVSLSVAGLLLAVGVGLRVWAEPRDNGAAVDRAGFEEHYERWKRHCAAVSASSDLYDRLGSPDFRAIVQMGPAVLPYVVEKCRTDPTFQYTGWAWIEITGTLTDPAVYPWAKESLLDWWAAGPQRIRDRVALLTAQWKTLTARGEFVISTKTSVFDPGTQTVRVKEEFTELGMCHRSLRALGIAVLPLVMEQIRAGDYSLMWLVRDITQGEAGVVNPRDTQQSGQVTLAWWEENKAQWTIPWPGQSTP